MKNLTNDEINKILAEFEDGYIMKGGGILLEGEDGHPYLDNPYTQDLNATARVWKKLESYPIFDESDPHTVEMLTEEKYEGISYVWAKRETIQESCAHATALAILELQKEKDSE